MLVDFHAHHTASAHAEAMARFGDATARRAGAACRIPTLLMRSPSGRRPAAGAVARHHGPYLPDQDQARTAAQPSNDGYAELMTRYPVRFAGLAALPLPHVDAALRELERGMLGAAMNCSVMQRSMAESKFEPIYAELNRRRAPDRCRRGRLAARDAAPATGAFEVPDVDLADFQADRPVGCWGSRPMANYLSPLWPRRGHRRWQRSGRGRRRTAWRRSLARRLRHL
jgi:hypothetical protein